MTNNTYKNTKLLILASNLAQKYHEGQTRSGGGGGGGGDYFQDHVIQVFRLVRETTLSKLRDGDQDFWVTCMCAALLHDVIEDTSATFQDLLHAGIPKEVCDIVDDVTKRPGETYFDFISRINESTHIGSAIVKFYDITHNLSDLKTSDRRFEKYCFARHMMKAKMETWRLYE